MKTPEEIHAILEGTKNVVRVVHIARPQHALLDFEREETAQLLKILSETAFWFSVIYIKSTRSPHMSGGEALPPERWRFSNWQRNR